MCGLSRVRGVRETVPFFSTHDENFVRGLRLLKEMREEQMRQGNPVSDFA
jgi:hypothetical protein